METDPGPGSASRAGVTRLLRRLNGGENGAFDELMPLVYGELRALAGAVFRGRPEQTLQPTALVHEAFLKMVGSLDDLDGSRHFFVVAGKAMRQVIADHARGRSAEKRGGGRRALTLDTDVVADHASEVDLVLLNESLERLAELNPRHAQVVELRIFSGFSVEDSAEILGLSPRTIKSDWAMAKAWLRRELATDSDA